MDCINAKYENNCNLLKNVRYEKMLDQFILYFH
jgi:hypothetical protein